MTISNLTQAQEIAFFVTGASRLSKDVVTLKITKVPEGWSQRLVSIVDNNTDHSLRVDYVSNETRNDLYKWFSSDFNMWKCFETQREAEEYSAERTRL
jgi:hypothetical protein